MTAYQNNLSINSITIVSTHIDTMLNVVYISAHFITLTVKSINEAVTGLHWTIPELMNIASSKWIKGVKRLEEPVELG